MPTSALFDFRDASLTGDPKWSRASPTFAIRAPPLILLLAILSITEIILGVVWIVSIDSLSSSASLTFAQVIQPLIVPALSFFNTIPSLHLHVLARSNNPVMAMWFSGLLCVLFVGSAVAFIPPCADLGSWGPGPEGRLSSVSGYQRTECPPGSKQGVWGAMVALQFVTGVGYATHFAMAWWVRRQIGRYETGLRSGDIVELAAF